MYEDLSDQAPGLPFYVKMVHAGPHRNLQYVVADTAGRRAVAVDPSFELERMFADVEEEGFRIDRAVFTHAHWDHIGGVPEVFGLGVEKVGIHEAAAEHPKVKEAEEHGAVRLLKDDETVDVGGIPIRVLHTPGHQPEAACYLVGDDGFPQALFGGDTVFVGSCGRTDFPGGDTAAMHASMARLRGLEGDVTLFPGHLYHEEPCRPLAVEREENPALATADRDAFGDLPFLRG